MKKHTVAIHIFRRDLRLQDNTALLHALKESESVIPCFIFDPKQVTKNSYRSDNAVQFMTTSLQELDDDLHQKDGKLYLFYGPTKTVIQDLIKQTGATLLTINKDYTPFSLKRDQDIQSLCEKQNIECSIHEDAILNKPENVVKADKTPYTVFTPYKKNAQKIPVAKPQQNRHKNYYTKKINDSCTKSIYKEISPEKNKAIKVSGGRLEGLKLLKRATTLKHYQEQRNFPANEYTSNLSAHHKFGTISIRESYHVIKEAGIKTMIDELYWRDFFTNITYHFPHVIGNSFREKYDQITWSNDKKLFNAWCKGETGFPIVDAGMRELNKTGFMHNRVRMITASFLVKDLKVDWRWGEKYFAQKLVDYDPAVNNGNWQWAASTGCDAQPYFRIFNPWSQQERFDPDCIYIKTWIPELKNIEVKLLHKLHKKDIKINGYPKPIIDHAIESRKTLAMFKKI